MIQAGGETLWSGVHQLVNSIWNEEELPNQGKESIIVPIHQKGDKKLVIIVGYITTINCIQNLLSWKDRLGW
jgi:hypothetical protein